MLRFALPGSRLLYRIDNVPKEVISIVIQLGGKGSEYLDLKAVTNSSSLRWYSSAQFRNNQLAKLAIKLIDIVSGIECTAGLEQMVLLVCQQRIPVAAQTVITDIT